MYKNLIHEQMINYYSHTRIDIKFIKFCNKNDVDLKEMNLKDFIKKIIMKKNIKKINLLKIYYIH